MKVGDLISVSGCVTQEKFIAGRTLREIEKIIGYHQGRLSHGGVIAVLVQLPEIQQFDIAGYSNVAKHNQTSPTGLDIEKLKAQAKATWSLAGPIRLIKILPTTRHDGNLNPDFQYPNGLGAPQWEVKVSLWAKVSALLNDYPNGRYVSADVARY
jgi:hypothetical protein